MIPRLLSALGTLAVLIGVNLRVWDYESSLASGDTLYIPIQGGDPRSLVQGDYMRYRLSVTVPSPPEGARAGLASLQVDERGVVTSVTLPPEGGGIEVPWSREDDDARIIPTSWFIEEGTAELYDGFAFARVHRAANGKLLLVGLADEQLRALGPARIRW